MRPSPRNAEAGPGPGPEAEAEAKAEAAPRAEAAIVTEAQAQALAANTAIAALRARGAAHIDPLRFGLIEALARRASGHGGALAQRLQRRLGELLRACGAQLDQADADADALAAQLLQRHPQASAQIQRCRLDAAAYPVSEPSALSSLRRLAQQLVAQAARAPLAELLARLHPPAPGSPAAAGPDQALVIAGTFADSSAHAPTAAVPPGPPAELKALSQFRQGWVRLYVAQQLHRSKRQAPENAGPLHSQGLVLRALQQLQSISPDYLERLVPHLESLIWLERAPAAAPPRASDPGRRNGSRAAPRPARRKAG